ncbi:MAG: hypothetical protein IKS78_03710, partial [Clostridia bacterium]|nr:hypothetical protein [Clostridia bacterium]
MKTIKSVYKIGNGPSSSHTVGPYNAAQVFKSRYPDADAFRVTLFGSLAFTGEGHGTQKAIKSAIPGAVVVFDREKGNLPHPNTMLFEAFKGSTLLGSNYIYSVGGGSIRIENEESDDEKEVYPQKYFSEILKICHDRSLNLAQFISRMEGPSLYGYLQTVWEAMKDSIHRGLNAEGILPGGLGVAKKAKIQDNNLLYNIVRPIVDFNARRSYRRFEVHGQKNLPKDGALIFGINHSNTLMDALVVLATSRHKKVFMARGDIFANPTVAKILKFNRILPLFRIRNGAAAVRSNTDSI